VGFAAPQFHDRSSRVGLQLRAPTNPGHQCGDSQANERPTELLGERSSRRVLSDRHS
jgi:hypothetical protein